jgi:hypothetical protein
MVHLIFSAKVEKIYVSMNKTEKAVYKHSIQIFISREFVQRWDARDV